ncbi:MAG: hypothetical protein KGL92_03300 [Gammaproteobacteria bacterium]|nr:hypothetical protein [Gammaproteobacteria bacterium]
MDISQEHAVETYKSLIHFGTAGLKFVLTANGAAAVGILTFLGHFVASGKSPVPDLRLPLAVLLGGVLLGGVATATGYFTQLTLYNEVIGNRSGSKQLTHVFWLRVSLALMFLGIGCFGVGALWAALRLQ